MWRHSRAAWQVAFGGVGWLSAFSREPFELTPHRLHGALACVRRPLYFPQEHGLPPVSAAEGKGRGHGKGGGAPPLVSYSRHLSAAELRRAVASGELRSGTLEAPPPRCGSDS